PPLSGSSACKPCPKDRGLVLASIRPLQQGKGSRPRNTITQRCHYARRGSVEPRKPSRPYLEALRHKIRSQCGVEEAVHALLAGQPLSSVSIVAPQGCIQRHGARVRRAREHRSDLVGVLALEDRAGGVEQATAGREQRP